MGYRIYKIKGLPDIGGFMVDKYDLDNRPIKEARVYGIAVEQSGELIPVATVCDTYCIPIHIWLEWIKDYSTEILYDILENHYYNKKS